MEPLYLPTGHITVHQVARQLGTTLGGVRQLVRREQFHHAGGTERQPWYDPDEVVKLMDERGPQGRRDRSGLPSA